MKIWFNDGNPTSPSGHYRATLPMRFLQHLDIKLTNCILNDDNYDAYLFHRIVHPAFLPHLLKLKEKNKIIIWELDDDLWHVPHSNPSYNEAESNIATLELCLQLSHHVIVTTEALKEEVEKHTQAKVHVLPNLLDADDWPKQYPVPVPKEQLHILWAGGTSHADDLAEITPWIIQQLHSTHNQFTFCGYCEPEILKHNSPNLVFIPHTHVTYWPRLLARLQPDIVLAPLAENPFNNCKSNIRFLEASMSGAVVVGTDFGPYQNLPMLYEFSPNLNSSQFRRYQINKAHEFVEEHFTFQNNTCWLDFFTNLEAL